MALLFIFYLAVVTFVNTLDKVQTMITVWIAVHAFTAVFGILHHGQGVGGWIGDENDLCMAMNVVIPFAFFALFSKPARFKKTLYIILLCICILAAMTTFSRGGFIGLVAVGMYCWSKSSRKMSAGLIVGLLAIFIMLFAPETFWDRIKSTTSDQTMEVGTGGE